MSFYSGIFDFFRSYGRHEIDISPSIPQDVTVVTNPFDMTNAKGVPLSQVQKNTLDSFAKDLRNLGKSNLRGLLKEFYFQLKDKTEMHKTLYGLRNNDVVQTIVDVMIDDGLMSSNDNKIFDIKYKGETENEEIQAEIDKFVNKFKLDQTIIDFIDEAIILGEYILPIEHEKGQGVTKILDNPYMVEMVGVYSGQDKKGFLRKKGKEVIEIEPDNGIHFILSYKKIRVEISNFAKSEKYYLEDHIKVGKSIILPIVNKLKQLEILEMANLALDLKRILAPVVVMVGMPENTQVKDIGSIVEEYEKILGNMFKNLGSVDEISFNDILSVAGEFKVLPSIGNTKGSISTLNMGEEKDSNSEKSESLRKSIALLLGIPFYYLSLMGENALSRLESLKLFSRYSRKLNVMQDCIITGVKELLYIHLKDLGWVVNTDDIFIGMRQITNVELLDSMEYLVALISALQELITVLSSVSELTNHKIKIDPKKLLEFLNKLLSEFPQCDKLLYSDDDEEIEPEKKSDNQAPKITIKKDIENDNEFKLKNKTADINVKRTNLNNEDLKKLQDIFMKIKGKK